MAFKIAVVSGKGGTGKTTVSVSLSNYFQRLWGAAVHLVDCDVEEPNTALFFPEKNMRSVAPVYQEIPETDLERCTFCRECSTYCSYNAIVVLPSVKFAQGIPIFVTLVAPVCMPVRRMPCICIRSRLGSCVI